jgi:hypothetical protein
LTSTDRDQLVGNDPLADYDPLSRAHQHDPYPFFRRAHSGCPVHHHVVPEAERRDDDLHENPLLGRATDHFFTVFGYEQVRDLLGRHEVFSSTQGPGPERLIAPNGVSMLLYADEPHHRLHRQIVNKAFTPRTVSRIEPRIREIVNEIVDGFVDRGRVEVVRNFAVPIPGTVFSELLGVPPRDCDQFTRWADELVAAFGGDAQAQAQSVVAMREIATYFLAEFTRRRDIRTRGGSLPDDLLTALMTAEVDGRSFDDIELFLALHIFLAGGHETTASGLANAIHLLAEHPDQLQLLRADRALIPNAVEEVLRFESPIQRLFRTPHLDTEIAGCPIEAGDKVSVMFGAANRDPRAWPNPDVFEVTRDPRTLRKHLAFGFGIHACVGAALARAELRIAIETLLDRIGTWRLDPAHPPVRGGNLIVRTYAELPIMWDIPAASPPERPGTRHGE